MKKKRKTSFKGAIREHRAIALNGWVFLFAVIALLGFAGYKTVLSVMGDEHPPVIALVGVGLGFLCLRGLFTLQPNQGSIASFFGAYVGTIKGQGLRWTIPFFRRTTISLRSHNLNTPTLKVP